MNRLFSNKSESHIDSSSSDIGALPLDPSHPIFHTIHEEILPPYDGYRFFPPGKEIHAVTEYRRYDFRGIWQGEGSQLLWRWAKVHIV